MTRSADKEENISHTTSPVPEKLARWLLDADAGQQNDPEALAALGERVYHRLRTHLAVLLGDNGFDALWARAIHLAQPNFRIGDNTAAAEAFPTRAAHAYGLYAAVRGHDPAVVQHNLAQPNFRIGDNTAAAEAFPTRAAHAYGLYAAVRGHDPAVVQHNLVVAFASLITLLFTFIGEELSLHFIRQLWPDLPQDVAESRADGATS